MGSTITLEPETLYSLMQMTQAVVQVSCGEHHSAALTASGDLYIWGRLGAGRLGLRVDRAEDGDGVGVGAEGKVVEDIEWGQIAGMSSRVAECAEENAGIVHVPLLASWCGGLGRGGVGVREGPGKVTDVACGVMHVAAVHATEGGEGGGGADRVSGGDGLAARECIIASLLERWRRKQDLSVEEVGLLHRISCPELYPGADVAASAGVGGDACLDEARRETAEALDSLAAVAEGAGVRWVGGGGGTAGVQEGARGGRDRVFVWGEHMWFGQDDVEADSEGSEIEEEREEGDPGYAEAWSMHETVVCHQSIRLTARLFLSMYGTARARGRWVKQCHCDVVW